MFSNNSNNQKMTRDSFWIKNNFFSWYLNVCLYWYKRIMYFCNLTMKMKMHFNEYRFEISNRVALFKYYDEFLALSRFSIIKFIDFKSKSTRTKTNKRKIDNINVEEFDYFNDEININKANDDFEHDSCSFIDS